MISSKALIDQTGISRATLNNYIQLGILPKPDVQSLSASADEGGARVLGFFPDDALERVQAVQILKSQGLSMAQVAERLAQTDALLEVQELQLETASARPAMRPIGRSNATRATSTMPEALGHLSLSLDTLTHPAYMLNYNFELGSRARASEIISVTRPMPKP